MADKAKQAVRLTLRAGRAGLPRDLDRAGMAFVNHLTVQLSKPGTGINYEQHLRTRFVNGKRVIFPIGPRPPHTASREGYPPAVDTGRLRASYSWAVTKAVDPYVEIGTGSEYAVYLEFGTSLMAPRPHLRPTVQAKKFKVTAEVADGIVKRERAMARRLGGRG